LSATPGPLTVNPLLFKSMAYDPAKLTPIAIILSVPNVLVVKSSLDVKTFPQLATRAKAAPGKLFYGYQGIGSTTHLTAALLAKRAGIEIAHVPYRGSPQAIMDLTSGVLDMMFDNVGSALPQHNAGTARIIGVADSARSPLLPETPTLEESGLKDFRSVTWFGLVGPPGLAGELAQKISADVAKIVRSSSYAERLRGYSATPVGSSPQEAAEYMRTEAEVWGSVIRDAGLTPQ
jgi:tripartite-type tricarboxylate transporter receptor subunit TctC